MEQLEVVPHVDQCRIFSLQHLPDARGNLTVVEPPRHCPFEIKRIFYMQEVPEGQGRGAHAHKRLHQFVICMCGRFEVELQDGVRSRTVLLDNPQVGLHIPPGIWASEKRFSADAICLVLASDIYSEADYIRDFDEYLRYIG